MEIPLIIQINLTKNDANPEEFRAETTASYFLYVVDTKPNTCQKSKGLIRVIDSLTELRNGWWMDRCTHAYMQRGRMEGGRNHAGGF